MSNDIDTTRFIEECIGNHYIARITAGKSDCDYRVSPEDFQVFVKRMSAKVEHTPGQYHGRDCHFEYVTLHVADVGTTRVYSHPEVGRGAYEPCELSEPRIKPIDFAALKKDRESTQFVFAEPAIAVGDVVTLKSGGQRMTVVNITEDRCCCAWSQTGSSYPIFGASGPVMMREIFPTITLERLNLGS